MIAALLGGRLFFNHLGEWLAIADEPAPADLIVCLGGGEGRVELATQLLNDGVAGSLMVTTDGVRRQVLRRGVEADKLILPKRFALTTYDEALALNEVMREGGFSSAIVVSDAYHLYRVKWSFAHACKDLPVTLRYVSGRAVPGFALWWRERWSRLYVVREVSKLVYYWFGHGLLGIDHDPEWLSGVKGWYYRVLDKVV